MDTLDHYIKHDLGIKYYGRYVDDFVIVHENKEFLKSLVPKLKDFLQSELKLKLHPKKIHLQHYSKDVKFIGAVINPNRIYIANRTKGNFYNAIQKQNIIARDHKPTKQEQKDFQATMNSYLGIMSYYQSYKLRKRMIFKELSAWWWNYLYLSGGIKKFEMKVRPAKRMEYVG